MNKRLLFSRAFLVVVAPLVLAAVLTTNLPAVSQTQSAEYVLGPEDVIEVSVWGYPDLTKVIIVLPDGKITLPLVGAVAAAGQRVEQLTRALQRAYSVYVINPNVTVIVKEFRRVRVSVLGQVVRPGAYTLSPGSGIVDAISAAGGTTEVAAMTEVRLLRSGAQATIVNLERLLAGDEQANVALRGGETIVVPEDLVNLVNVIGEVVRPGRYRLKSEMRVLDALLAAGGLTQRASVTQARLVHVSRESQPLHLDTLLLRQDMSRNTPLKPGDTLFIPEEIDNKIYVLGDVNRPGVYEVKGDMTVLQALATAGGPVQRGAATAKLAQIVRRNGGPDRTVVAAGPSTAIKVEALPNGGALLSIDLRSLMSNSAAAQAVVVQVGDVMVVPQNGLNSVQLILSILSGILGFAR